MTTPSVDAPPAGSTGIAARFARISSVEWVFIGFVFFILNGALIVWTPLWRLLPLWLLPPVMVTLAAYRLVREHREGRRNSGLRLSFVVLAGLVIAVVAVVGTNELWFRAGVELRLWRVGGLPRVEAFARQHIDVLRAEWQAMGGSSGRARLDQDGLKHFTFLFPPDRPDWLAPLTRYLRGRIHYDQDDLPTAIEFRLSGFDHGWGMSVYRDAQPDAAEARGVNRLSERSFLWGRP